MRGTLNPSSLSRALREIASSGREGVLHLVCDDTAKRIYLREGCVIFAGSDREDERLGALLIRSGKLSRAELALALGRAKKSGDILGTVLVGGGVVSRGVVEDHARERTEAIVASAFDWPYGSYFFQEKRTEVRKEVALELPVVSVLLKVAQTMELDRVRLGLAESQSTLRRSAHPGPVGDVLASESVARWVLDRSDGPAIEELVQLSPASEEETLRALYGLVLAGLVELEALVGSTADFAELEDSLRPESSRSEAPGTSLSGPRPTTLGRYEVVKLLGRGAMGAVYLAKDPAIDRTVAVKLIQTAVEVSATEFEKYRERFHREAKAAGKLLHPGIVAVFDLGYAEDATPFIVMEHVEGRTLREVVATDAPAIETLLRYAVEILAPLAYAHENGIVHRDIKPTNILITDGSQVKLMDFGIAHISGSELTNEHDVLGSPNYMAPEQLLKRPVDARTDLFAFGVLLYWMLTSKLPFAGDSIPAIAHAIVHEDPQPPHVASPAVDPEISAIVMRCLSKEPSARFDSAETVRAAIVAVLGGGTAPERTEPALSGLLSASDHRVRGTGALRVSTGRVAAAAAAVALVVSLSLVARPRSGPESLPAAAGALSEAASWTDAELYREAARALEAGDISRSRSILTELMGRNPTYEGAAELSVRTAPARQSAPRDPVVVASDVDAQLFYEARLAYDQGRLGASVERLDSLLRNNPSFVGAAQLLVDVNDARWQRTLPKELAAVHNHRIGECSGTVTLGVEGVRFVSDTHDWSWGFDDIRTIRMPTADALTIETHETELLTLGRPKNYKFTLDSGWSHLEWERYDRLFRRR